MTTTDWNLGPNTMAPIIRAVCQELPHGYARERILYSILTALEKGGPGDHGWCMDPPFQRVWILSNGYMAGQASHFPKRPPWWVKDQGPAAVSAWLREYALGALDRDLNYDQEKPVPAYLPVPDIEESLDDDDLEIQV